MAFVPALLSGLGFLGGVLGNRPQTNTQKQQSASTGTNYNQNSGQFINSSENNTSSSSNPTLNPTAASLLKEITDKYSSMLGQDPDLTGYQAGQSESINHLSDIQKQQAQENLAARGITSGAAVGNATNAVDNNRFQQLNQLNQSIPLLKQQLVSQMIGQGQGIFSSIPVGNTTVGTNNSKNEGYTSGDSSGNTTGTQTGSGSTTTGGNMLGGGIGNLTSILAYLYGKGSFGGGGGSQTATY